MLGYAQCGHGWIGNYNYHYYHCNSFIESVQKTESMLSTDDMLAFSALLNHRAGQIDSIADIDGLCYNCTTSVLAATGMNILTPHFIFIVLITWKNTS